MRRMRSFARCTRASRAAVTRSVQHGRRDGRRIASGNMGEAVGISSRLPPAFRVRTIVRHGCTGRARARGDGRCAGAIARYQLTIADYHNTYYGRLAEGTFSKARRLAGQSSLVFAQGAAQIGGEDDYFPPTEGTIRTLLARRALRACREGAGVRARKVGGLARHHCDDRVGEQTDGRVGIGCRAVRARPRLDHS